MFKLISDLNLCDVVTREYAGTVGTAGTSGQWVTIDSDGKFAFPVADAGLAFPIWTEGNRDGSAGFSPDVVAIGKVSVLNGKFRAVTDQVVSSDYASLSVGDALVVKSGGELGAVTPSAAEASQIAGYVSSKIASVVHLGTTFTNCIEFYSR